MGAMIRNNFVIKSETEEDFVKKKGSNSFGGNGFFGGAENHPLTKAVVDHDQ